MHRRYVVEETVTWPVTALFQRLDTTVLDMLRSDTSAVLIRETSPSDSSFESGVYNRTFRHSAQSKRR